MEITLEEMAQWAKEGREEREMQKALALDEQKLIDLGAMVREEAEKRVLAIRGSYDAPGFEVCVESEMQNIAEEINHSSQTKG